MILTQVKKSGGLSEEPNLQFQCHLLKMGHSFIITGFMVDTDRSEFSEIVAVNPDGKRRHHRFKCFVEETYGAYADYDTGHKRRADLYC